jgi:hypothetical protein
MLKTFSSELAAALGGEGKAAEDALAQLVTAKKEVASLKSDLAASR